jgi:geranylgeranyl reductase family protein
VVGGGPAGSSAAFVLASAGIRVCLIDRSRFPRDKLCGGLLTQRSKKLFESIFHADWSPAIHAVSPGAKFFYRTRLLREVSNYKNLCFTARRDFDAFLLDLARQRGAQIMEGGRVTSVDVANSTLTLASGSRLNYSFLIGADGVNSLVAKVVFSRSFSQRTIGFGLEMEVPISTENPPVAAPEIYFGLIDWGYAWVFPKRTTVTAGIGGLWRKNPDLPPAFKKFLCQRFGQIPAAAIKGHYVPFGDFRPIPGQGLILLCGDAAGLVDPITGEGIAYAMQSGSFAAEAVREALAVGQPDRVLEFYQKRYALITANLCRANALRRFLFPGFSQILFSKVLPLGESLPKRHMDLMADDISYQEYRIALGRLAFHGIPKVLFKLLAH